MPAGFVGWVPNIRDVPSEVVGESHLSSSRPKFSHPGALISPTFVVSPPPEEGTQPDTTAQETLDFPLRKTGESWIYEFAF